MGDHSARRPTVKSERFLRDYELKMGPALRLADWCRDNGYTVASVQGWRRGIAGFKEQMDAIQARFGQPAPSMRRILDAKVKTDGERYASMEARLAIYLRAWEDSLGRPTARTDALTRAGLEVADVNEAMASVPEFASAVAAINARLDWLIEDQVIALAVSGSNPAGRLMLESRRPEEYRKKVDVKVTGSVVVSPGKLAQSREKWQQRFGELTTAALPAAVSEEVDGEIVNEVEN